MTRPMMKQRTFVYFVAAFFVLFFAARAEAITVVSPAVYEDTEANGRHIPGDPYPTGVTPFPNGFRDQNLYPALDFSSLGPGPLEITSLAIRPGGSVNEPVSAEWNIAALNLSTTTAEPGSLSTTWANNYGTGGFTTVLSGIVRLETDGVPRPGELPHDFDYVFDFQTPYVYDPQQGNLLVEFISATDVPLERIWLDGTLGGTSVSEPDGQVFAYDPDARSGILFNSINIMQFTIIPEPSSIALTAFGLAGLLAWRRKKPSEA